jgi:hypothetical protein
MSIKEFKDWLREGWYIEKQSEKVYPRMKKFAILLYFLLIVSLFVLELIFDIEFNVQFLFLVMFYVTLIVMIWRRFYYDAIECRYHIKEKEATRDLNFDWKEAVLTTEKFRRIEDHPIEELLFYLNDKDKAELESLMDKRREKRPRGIIPSQDYEDIVEDYNKWKK